VKLGLLLVGVWLCYFIVRRYQNRIGEASVSLFASAKPSAREGARLTAPYAVALVPITAANIPVPIGERQVQDSYFRGVLPSGEAVYFGVKPANTYIEVWARTRRKGEKAGVFTGPYKNFSFHPPRNRWSYASAPPGTSDIRPMIQWIERQGLN
jgi:hypothetical protein